MCRGIALLVMFVIAALPVRSDGGEAYYPGSLVGLSGEELMAALRVAVRNHESVMPQFDENVIWSVFNETDRRGDGTVWDMFSPDIASFPLDGGAPAGMECCHVVYPEWIGDKMPYSMDMSLDLHNVFPCRDVVAEDKRGLVPWKVDNATFDNGIITIGGANIDGTVFRAYEPCDEYKGDIARVLMYVAACYGGEQVWYGQSWNLFLEGAYPVFNRRAAELLLSWHQSDPVSLKEQERNDVVYRKQGNRNPFVDYPRLADHIWGEAIDVPFSYNTGGGDGEIAGYLRSTYVLEDTVWLRSNYVPSGAVWSVNGSAVAGDCIPASTLGIGSHELRFSIGEMKGKVTIEVR